jgi:HEAT repeat protein
MRFRLPGIDAFSFWLGFIFSAFIWWVITLLRPPFRQIISSIREKQKQEREKAHTFNIVEEHYLQSVLLQVQGMHLAAPIFSLEEIIEQPLLLAPPPRVVPGNPPMEEDIVDATVPYLPAWPELAGVYKAPTVTLPEALSGDSDIVLTGQTGMGKTVALANLASRLARHEHMEGLASGTIPLIVHIADIDLNFNYDNPLDTLLDFVAEKTPIFEMSRISSFLRKAFAEGKVLVLLDGTDELPADKLKLAVEYIRAIKRAFPRIRMITTASTEYLDGLVSLNFIPFTISSWDSHQRAEFLQRWANLWDRFVSVESWAQVHNPVDPLLLNSWIGIGSEHLSPLELTLKTWGAYAGDLLGPSPQDAIETHIRRLSSENAPREALDYLALQIILTSEPFFTPQKAKLWVKSFEPEDVNGSEEIGENPEEITKKVNKQQITSPGIISQLNESGLLTQQCKNQVRFIHPIFIGYLAGKLLSSHTETLLQQSPWIGKFLGMHYLAAQGDASVLAESLLEQFDRPMSRNLLVTARWLRDAPLQAQWRTTVMEKLADLLQQSGQPLGLRGQALAAFIQSGDPGVTVLFRHFLSQNDSELLQLTALGSGALNDVKSVEILSSLLTHSNSNVRRAACLALASIGSTAAMDALANSLLHGDDILRRAASEAMANQETEGHAMLIEGSQMKEDLQVRRAVTYGLGRIKETWAGNMLMKMQTEDEQWLVRSAASEVLEGRSKPNPHIPQRLPPPSESPWLIAFAGKKGEGISPEKPPTDLLLMALKSDNLEEQLASLEYLKMLPMEGVFGSLFQAMYAGDVELRESVFRTLSEMAARGVDVPDPVQFGVGY